MRHVKTGFNPGKPLVRVIDDPLWKLKGSPRDRACFPHSNHRLNQVEHPRFGRYSPLKVVVQHGLLKQHFR